MKIKTLALTLHVVIVAAIFINPAAAQPISVPTPADSTTSNVQATVVVGGSGGSSGGGTSASSSGSAGGGTYPWIAQIAAGGVTSINGALAAEFRCRLAGTTGAYGYSWFSSMPVSVSLTSGDMSPTGISAANYATLYSNLMSAGYTGQPVSSNYECLSTIKSAIRVWVVSGGGLQTQIQGQQYSNGTTTTLQVGLPIDANGNLLRQAPIYNRIGYLLGYAIPVYMPPQYGSTVTLGFSFTSIWNPRAIFAVDAPLQVPTYSATTTKQFNMSFSPDLGSTFKYFYYATPPFLSDGADTLYACGTYSFTCSLESTWPGPTGKSTDGTLTYGQNANGNAGGVRYFLPGPSIVY